MWQSSNRSLTPSPTTPPEPSRPSRRHPRAPRKAGTRGQAFEGTSLQLPASGSSSVPLCATRCPSPAPPRAAPCRAATPVPRERRDRGLREAEGDEGRSRAVLDAPIRRLPWSPACCTCSLCRRSPAGGSSPRPPATVRGGRGGGTPGAAAVPGDTRGRGALTTCFCLRGFTQKVPSACWGGENKGVSAGAEPSSLGATPKQPQAPSRAPSAPAGCREGAGGPQPRSHLLEGGQQHVAVPGVLCKKTTSGGGGSGHTEPRRHPVQPGKWVSPPSPSPSSTTACTTMGNTSRSRSKPSCGGGPEERLGQEERGFVSHPLSRSPPDTPGFAHPKGDELPRVLPASWERFRAIPQPVSDLGGPAPDPVPSDAAHLLLGPLGGVDGVGGHAELLAHAPLVAHRLRLQAAVPGDVAVPRAEGSVSRGAGGAGALLP